MMKTTKLTFPTYLTLFRLCFSPIILPFLIVNFVPANDLFINISIAGVLFLFGLTDFFDGYLARRYVTVSRLGKILDPLADKFLMYSTLVALLAVGKIYYLWVLLLIGREIFIMGLRQVSLEYNISVVVSSWGKLKTTVHFIYLFLVIINPVQGQGYGLWWNSLELLLLVMSLLISLGSAIDYYIVFYRQIKL